MKCGELNSRPDSGVWAEGGCWVVAVTRSPKVQKHQEQRAATPATRLETGVEAQLAVGWPWASHHWEPQSLLKMEGGEGQQGDLKDFPTVGHSAVLESLLMPDTEWRSWARPPDLLSQTRSDNSPCDPVCSC